MGQHRSNIHTKRCQACGKHLPVEEFYGSRSRCRKCYNYSCKQYRIRHKTISQLLHGWQR